MGLSVFVLSELHIDMCRRVVDFVQVAVGEHKRETSLLLSYRFVVQIESGSGANVEFGCYLTCLVCKQKIY